ncbi:hypothetical protein, partial [Serratia marcescens]|uniref:hypothetical protein n=1 Tax=Serratia marcescens TaxID=615 RepID=UPI00195538C0
RRAVVFHQWHMPLSDGFQSGSSAQDRQRFRPMLLSANIDEVDDSYRLNARAINENGNKI